MPNPKVARIRLDPKAVETRSLALDVQVGEMPGDPGACAKSLTSHLPV
jgi:hypothetical protein